MTRSAPVSVACFAALAVLVASPAALPAPLSFPAANQTIIKTPANVVTEARRPAAPLNRRLAAGRSSGGAAAQVPNPPAPRLLNAKTLRCSFTTLATGTWKDGAAEASVRPAKLAIAFMSIDAQDGTADAVSDTRKAHITVRVVGNYMTLMQLDAYGALYVTTVFNTEGKDGRLLAVHTRHEYTPVQLPGVTSRPEQYYGDCEVK